MGLIVAAIRGGPASQGAEERAIELALTGQHRLLYLHVVEESLFDLAAGVRAEAVLEELKEMGEFIVAMAQERAREAGVEASTLVRVGRVVDEIVRTVKEQNADVLVVGASRPGSTLRIGHAGLHGGLGRRVKDETSAALVIAPPVPTKE